MNFNVNAINLVSFKLLRSVFWHSELSVPVFEASSISKSRQAETKIEVYNGSSLHPYLWKQPL